MKEKNINQREKGLKDLLGDIAVYFKLPFLKNSSQ